MENRPWFVVRVRRIFLDGPVYGEGSVFCSLFALSHTNGARRTTGMGTGTTRRTRAEIPTTHLLCSCVLLRTGSAPNTRIARAPELVQGGGMFSCRSSCGMDHISRRCQWNGFRLSHSHGNVIIKLDLHYGFI